MNEVILLPSPISKVKENVNPRKLLYKNLAHVIINGGTPEDYQAAYYEIPGFMGNLRATFVERILRKARQESWQVSQLGEVMSALNQM